MTRPLAPNEVIERLDELAQLRIEVFADYPYLYAGDVEYERRYLQPYIDSEAAIVVAALVDDRLIGAATGTPMEAHADDFQHALEGFPEPLSSIFYCAESVLLPAWRGHGLGHVFFDHREAHARKLGHRYCAFCSVIRPQGHPAQPPGYRSLEPFWRRRGYAPLDEAIATYRWRDLGELNETTKHLQFWIRRL